MLLPKNSRVQTLLFLSLSLLAVSLACSAAETLVNGTPTPMPSPTETLIPTETPAPTVTPIPTLDWTPVACTGDDCLNACMSPTSTWSPIPSTAIRSVHPIYFGRPPTTTSIRTILPPPTHLGFLYRHHPA